MIYDIKKNLLYIIFFSVKMLHLVREHDFKY